MTRKAILLSSIISLSLGACGGLQVKSWILSSKDDAIVRRNGGQIVERMTYIEADGYRCYSRLDDQAIRDRMALLERCCNQP